MELTADQLVSDVTARLTAGARVLVIGGGFIGSRAAKTLSERGIAVDVLTRSRPTLPTGKAQIVIGDASDSSTIKSLVESATSIFYCAGGLMPAQTMSLQPQDIALTLAPLANVLEAAVSDDKTRRFVFLSSGGTVYGVPTSVPVREDHPLSPISGYGVLKLCSEQIVGMFMRQHGLQCTVLRCANVYGDDQPTKKGQGAVGVFLEKLMNNQPITIYGDGSVMRDYVHVDDVVAAMAASMVMPVPAVLNVGSGQGTTLRDLVGLLETITGISVTVDYVESRPNEVPRIVLDVSALMATTGLRPAPISDGLEQVWERLEARSQGVA